MASACLLHVWCLWCVLCGVKKGVSVLGACLWRSAVRQALSRTGDWERNTSIDPKLDEFGSRGKDVPRKGERVCHFVSSFMLPHAH